jgi:integrase
MAAPRRYPDELRVQASTRPHASRPGLRGVQAERSRRTLALPIQLVDALRAHRAAQLEERITAGSLWEDHDLVFAQANGRPIERKSDWQAWKALLHEAGGREVRLHDGRHTAATLLLSEGVHPRVVMEVPGHAQMRTTTDTYSHGHLQPRHACPRPRRRRPDGRCAVGTAGTVTAPVATTLAPETTKAAPRIGERPGQRGGAEGTRTPDPHTARAAGRGPRSSVKVHPRRSRAHGDCHRPLRTAVNAVLWPPRWHPGGPRRCPRP